MSIQTRDRSIISIRATAVLKHRPSFPRGRRVALMVSLLLGYIATETLDYISVTPETRLAEAPAEPSSNSHTLVQR